MPIHVIRNGLILLLLTMDLRASPAASRDDRLERIMVQWVSRDYDALRVQIHEALAVYGAAPDRQREGIAYLFLSLADAATGDVQNTRVHLGEAMTRLEAAGDDVGAWLAYWLIAEHERVQTGQSDDAIAFYEKALARLEKTKSPFSIDALMVIGPIAGLPPADYEPDATTGAVDEHKMLQLLETFTRIGYGAVLVDIAELEKAEAQLRRARGLAARFDGRLDAPIDHHTGRLQRRRGQLDEARESFSKALEGTRASARLKVDTFLELADIAMLHGKIEDALAWNDRALEIVRAAQSTENEIRILTSRAELLTRAGRFAAAENVFAQALAIAEKHDAFDAQVSIHLHRSAMNKSRGRYAMAAADMERAIEALTNANQPLREPLIWSHLAISYLQLGANESGRMAMEKARTLAEKSGRCFDVAVIDLLDAARRFMYEETSYADFYKTILQASQTPEVRRILTSDALAQLAGSVAGIAPADPGVLTNNGIASAAMADLFQAGLLFSQARDYPTVRELATRSLDRGGLHRNHRAAALMMIGGSWLAEGNDERAIDALLESIDTATEEETTADQVVSGSGGPEWEPATFELLVDLLVKRGRSEEAFTIAERARARVFLQLLGNARITPRGAGNSLAAQEAETLRMQILQWQRQLRVAPEQQLEDDLREARRRYEALMTRVKASNPEYAAMRGVSTLGLDAIRKALPPETTLVSYFVTTLGVHAWTVDETTLHYVRLPIAETILARAECTASRFSAAGRGVHPVDAPCEPASTVELYLRLFAPLRPHVRTSRLIIVPHGVLHRLPFAAFRDPATRRHLIEDYTIAYVPSASAMHFLREKETPVNGHALVIGAPAGVSPELPGARREATRVGAALRSRPMLGAEAKESLLYGLHGNVDLVHIAAHGFYEPDTPLFSRIALAEGDGSDGNLEVHEILSDVDLTGVNLVVLSACKTALGKHSTGDESVGLTRALLYAGAPGVIATLWDISDDAASALMSELYRRLLDGDSAADALRHAQLALLRGRYADPSQWAAFTLNGNPEGRWTH